MIEQDFGQFNPDYAVPPGETLLETLDALGMSQAELAERMGRPKKTINEIVKGKSTITPETAIQLERVVGVPAGVWLSLEQNYRTALAKQDEARRLLKENAWLSDIPWVELNSLGWLSQFTNTAELIDAVLKFFGVASPDAWRAVWGNPQASYRKSAAFEISPGALAAWLRRGEIIGQQTECGAFDSGGFLSALCEVRKLTTAHSGTFVQEIPALCAPHGVVVAFVRELPGSRASGAARWLSSKKALIQVSLRYKSDDHLWFTLFHEAGHILLHGKRDRFLDTEEASTARGEAEANQFAADFLIPPSALKDFLSKRDYSAVAVQRFAYALGIAPGIVVGRLQHDEVVHFRNLNHLKRRFEWVKPEATG